MTVILVFALLSTVYRTVYSVDSHAATDLQHFNQKGACPNPGLCIRPVSQGVQRYCRETSDCGASEYCHSFHRLCIKHEAPITIAPVRTSAKKCSKNSDCKRKQYCHHMWKICLFAQEVAIQRPTKRPAWYCDSSADCRIEQQCHMTFHACYNRPRISTVRRSDPGFRLCQNKSDCGRGFYCHDHFRLCLKIVTGVVFKDEPTKKKNCVVDGDCRKGMKCHQLWKLCYTPPRKPVIEPKKKTQRQCRIDSDCKKNEFCHRVPSKAIAVVARHRRDVQSFCLPLSFKDSLIKPLKRTKCKTNADCGPNKCCLHKLGVCQAYQLPGGICLLEKTDFVCPCTNSSYCMDKNKTASPRRIINKMKLSKTVADHVMEGSHKKKYKVGKCMPGHVG